MCLCGAGGFLDLLGFGVERGRIGWFEGEDSWVLRVMKMGDNEL